MVAEVLGEEADRQITEQAQRRTAENRRECRRRLAQGRTSLSDADGNALGVRQPAGSGHPNAGERNFIQSLTQTLENE